MLHILSAHLIDRWEWQLAEHHLLQTPCKVHSNLRLLSQNRRCSIQSRSNKSPATIFSNTLPKITQKSVMNLLQIVLSMNHKTVILRFAQIWSCLSPSRDSPNMADAGHFSTWRLLNQPSLEESILFTLELRLSIDNDALQKILSPQSCQLFIADNILSKRRNCNFHCRYINNYLHPVISGLSLIFPYCKYFHKLQTTCSRKFTSANCQPNNF